MFKFLVSSLVSLTLRLLILEDPGPFRVSVLGCVLDPTMRIGAKWCKCRASLLF